jgi:sugar phosphate isomerase/epimerase
MCGTSTTAASAGPTGRLADGGITAFQLNDGPLRTTTSGTMLAQAPPTREGELDVVGLIRAVRGAGFTGPYCVESNTPELRNLPVAEAARRAADAAAGVLRLAGVML